jgi:hypothetical protein
VGKAVTVTDRPLAARLIHMSSTDSNSSQPHFNISRADDAITSALAHDAGILAKVQVVGSRDTVKAVTQFMAAVGSTTLDLMLDRRCPLLAVFGPIDRVKTCRSSGEFFW